MTKDFSNTSYEDLKSQAFTLAEKRHDLGFFYDLLRHTPAAAAAADEGGSMGDLSGSIVELIEASKELFGSGKVAEMQPLFRARFEEYLTKYSEQ
ncbi:MAG: hypothetical protein CMH41_09930 [Micrococcales bacterium]|nr:hypothetical protein [Micrococcales bacterium]